MAHKQAPLEHHQCHGITNFFLFTGVYNKFRSSFWPFCKKPNQTKKKGSKTKCLLVSHTHTHWGSRVPPTSQFHSAFYHKREFPMVVPSWFLAVFVIQSFGEVRNPPDWNPTFQRLKKHFFVKALDLFDDKVEPPLFGWCSSYNDIYIGVVCGLGVALRRDAK